MRFCVIYTEDRDRASSWQVCYWTILQLWRKKSNASAIWESTCWWTSAGGTQQRFYPDELAAFLLICCGWISKNKLWIVSDPIGHLRSHSHDATVVYDCSCRYIRFSHKSLQDQLQHLRANGKQELCFCYIVVYANVKNRIRQSYRVDRP